MIKNITTLVNIPGPHIKTTKIQIRGAYKCSDEVIHNLVGVGADDQLYGEIIRPAGSKFWDKIS